MKENRNSNRHSSAISQWIQCWDIRVTDAFGRYLIIVDLLHNQVQRSSHAGRTDTSQLYQQVET